MSDDSPKYIKDVSDDSQKPLDRTFEWNENWFNFYTFIKTK